MARAESHVRELLGAEPSRRLPDGMSVLDVAEGCRLAALAFVLDTPLTARGLAAWLSGPYRALVGAASDHAPVRSDQVVESALYARAYVAGVMRGMSHVPSDVSFSYAAMHDGWIERCRDATGRPGWLPVDRPRMRLTERVLSLVAVDYLVRPEEWLDGRISKIAV